MKPAPTTAQLIIGVIVLLSLTLLMILPSAPTRFASAQGEVNIMPTPIPSQTRLPSVVFTVDVSDDSSDGVCDQNSCSLRDAITAANQETVGWYVEIHLPSGTITFNQPDNNGTVDGAALNALPVIKRNISIVGTTTLQISEQAEPMRFFEVESWVSLSLTNVTLQGGNVGNADGGAIYTEGELLVFDGVFEGNSASNGGAVYMDSGGHLAVYNTEFKNNAALVAGGAIARSLGAENGNRLRLSESIFYGNTAGQRGGAVYSNGNIDISGSVFANNRVTGGDKGHVLYTDDSNTAQWQSIYNNCFTSNGTTKPQDDFIMYSEEVEIQAGHNWWGGTEPNPLNFNTNSDPLLPFSLVSECPQVFSEYITLEPSAEIEVDFNEAVSGGNPPYTITFLANPTMGTFEAVGDNVFRYTYPLTSTNLPPILDDFVIMVTDTNDFVSYQQISIVRLNGESNFDGAITPADVVFLVNRIGQTLTDNEALDLNLDGVIDASDVEILAYDIGLTPVPNPTPPGRLPGQD